MNILYAKTNKLMLADGCEIAFFYAYNTMYQTRSRPSNLLA